MKYRAKQANGRWRIQILRLKGWRNTPGFYDSRDHAEDNISDWEWLDGEEDTRVLQAMGAV